MATLVLSAAITGGLELGTASFLLASAAAMAVDNFLVYPALFPVPDQHGQRLSDLQLQDSAEGAPSNRPYGSAVRVSGTPVWMTELREVKNTENGGGKGGAGGAYIVYQYHVDAFVRIAKTRSPINRILKVVADGKDFWEGVPQVVISSDQIATTVLVDVTPGRTPGGPRNAGTAYIEITSDMAAGGPDLGRIKSGQNISISGFTDTPPSALVGSFTLGSPTVLNSPVLQLKSTATGSIYGTFTGPDFTSDSTDIVLFSGDVLVIDGDPQEYTVVNNGNLAIYGETEYAFTGTVGFPVTLNVYTQPLMSKVTAAGATVTLRSGAFRINDTSRGEPWVRASGRDVVANTSFARIDVHGAVSKLAGIDTIVIEQEFATHSQNQVADVRFFTGDQTQQPDALVSGVEEIKLGVGVGQVSAFRNRVGMLVDDLNMTDFGNRLPNFEFIVEVNGSLVTVGTVLSEILQDAGMGEAEFDVSTLTDEFVGFNIRGPQVTKSMLQPIFLAYQLISYEEAGKLVIQKRDALDTLTVDTDDLSAAGEGDQSSNTLSVIDEPLSTEVNAIEVSYRDPEQDYQTAIARTAKPQPRSGGQVNRINLDLSLRADVAQQLAETLLAQSQTASRRLRFTLPPSYEGQLHEGMRISIPNVWGQTWDIIVERVERGANNVMIIEGLEDDPDALTQAGEAEMGTGAAGSGTQDGPNAESSFVTAHILDIASLSDVHQTTPGFYVAATNSDTRRPWRGATVYRSTDTGVTFNPIHRVEQEAVMGQVISIPSTTVAAHYIDRVNTIRVEIMNDGFSLSSVAEEEAFRGHNLYLVGDEILIAANATLVSTDALRLSKVYDLTVLKRGLRDTEDEMTTHFVGERFVWLDGPGVEFVPVNQAGINQPNQFKTVAGGGKLALAQAYPHTLTGNSFRPFKPKQIVAARDGSNNVTLTWEYHSRAITQTLNQGAPYIEDEERYRIEFLKAGEVVRTVEVSGVRTLSYTAAEQTTDTLTPGDPIDVQIQQLSNKLFEGKVAAETV